MDITILMIVNFLLLVLLMGLLIYETRKISQLEEKEQFFIDSNAELFAVVNGNANILREVVVRQDADAKAMEFFKIILDAHAHALRVYGPALEFSKLPISSQIENLEKISGQDFEIS